jgi:hypothetical protein
VETGVSSVFPDLEKGIRFLSTFTKIPLDLYQFYALCFFLSTQEISDFWRFSNKEKDIIQKLIALLTVTENDGYNEVLVYAYGKDICLKANAVGRLIHPENDQEKQIIAVDSALPIRQTCDLKFKGQDIISTFEVKDAALIGEIISDLILNVITHQLPNEYEALKAHALKRIKLLDTGKGL